VLLSALSPVLPKTECFRLRNLSLVLFLLAAISLVAKPLLPAEVATLDDAIRQLADRIAAIPNLKGPIRLEAHDDAAFDETEGQGWKTTLRRELDHRKLSITEESAAPLLVVGATETPTQIVLAANLLFADHQELRVVALKRSALRAESLPVSPIRIEKQLLFESPEQILDASSAAKSATDELIVLIDRDSELTVLRLDPGGAMKQTLPLSAAGARVSRDPRAELITTGTDDLLQLPGKLCEFNWTATADIKCRASKTTWRVLPVLTSPCDSTAWKLEADSNDWTAGGVLQVVPEGASRQGSVALLSDFPGPILSINSAPNPHSAFVVVRNLRTGNYEVHKITLACGN
jgi:hypothetical protein